MLVNCWRTPDFAIIAVMQSQPPPQDAIINRPLTLPCGAVVPNRLAKAAMSEALADARGDVTDGMIALYRQWAEGGAGMLTTGNIPVDRRHLEHAANVVLDEDSDLTQMRRLAEAGRGGGGLILAQLNHAGRQTPESVNPRPLSLSPTKLELPGYGAPREATAEELENIVLQFARAAQQAEDSGFNGVEIHAAHGYLLSSALSPRINARNDEWGGTLEKRARLPLEVVRAVRAATKPVFVVGVKLNASDFQKGGLSFEDSAATAQMLQDAGADFIEVSGGNFEQPQSYQYQRAAAAGRDPRREAYFLEHAATVKAAVSIPVTATGGFRSRRAMESALAGGGADIIGMARPFIAAPDFPAKLLAGEIESAPAMERDFPPADELPRLAVLNWFCHQLRLRGTVGDADLSMPVLEGHEKYLAFAADAAKTRA